MKPTLTLTEGSIPRALFTFAIPILLGNVLQSVNGSINAIWIGKYIGAAALTGASNANIVMFLLLGSVFGVTMASTILIAQYVGARNMPEAKRVVGTSVTFFFVLSLMFSLGGYFLSATILDWMSTPVDAIPYGIDYMRVMFAGLPASYAFFFVSGALRGAGDSKTPFVFMVMSVVLDVLLNPLFIFGWGPVPAMGIAGSGLATVSAQSVSFIALMATIYRRRHPLALHAGEGALLKVDWQIVKSLIVKGLPMGLQMIVLSTSMVLMLGIVNGFGSDTSAAFAADMQLWNYVQMPAMSLGAAVSSMVAQNIGAGLWHRVRDTARYAVAFNFLLTGVPVLLIYALSEHFIGVFLPDGSPSLAIAQHANHIILWSFPLFGVSMVLSGVVRAAGAVVAPLMVLVLSLLVVRAPLAQYSVGHWGADGVWWSFVISSLVALTLTVVYYRFGNWRAARMTA